MSYAPVQEPRRRPPVVTSAVALLYLVVALIVVQAAVTMYLFSEIGDIATAVIGNRVSAAERATISGTFTTFGVIVLVIALMLAGGFLTMAILTGKGKNPARIVTWVFAGLGVLCCGFSAIGNALAPTSAYTSYGDTSSLESAGFDSAEFQRLVEERLPGWANPVGQVTTILGLLALILVVILLALPEANTYFAKPAYGWTPAYGYPQQGTAPYPGQPLQPGQPGYPATGYPPQPGYPVQQSPAWPPQPGAQPPYGPPPGYPGSPAAPDPNAPPSGPPAPPPQGYDPNQRPPGY